MWVGALQSLTYLNYEEELTNYEKEPIIYRDGCKTLIKVPKMEITSKALINMKWITGHNSTTLECRLV